MSADPPLLSARPGSEWLVGGGEMGRLVRGADWSATPLGPIGDWPAGLRTTVSLALSSGMPINILWGPEHTQIYNDAFVPLTADRHPAALGTDYSVCWASAFPAVGGAFHAALAGETAVIENLQIFVDRRGYLEECFYTITFSPIRDESGRIAGLFHLAADMTSTILGGRRTRRLREVAAAAVDADSARHGLEIVAAALGDSDADIPFALFYEVVGEGRTARLVASSGVGAGHPAAPAEVDLTLADGPAWPLGDVYRTGAAQVVTDVGDRFPVVVVGAYPEAVGTAVVLPIDSPGADHPPFLLVAGTSPRLPVDELYRSHLELVAATAGTVVANATALEVERDRAQALARIDRAKTEFFNNVSHEFRTPLTLMLGPVEDELAALGEGDPADRRERLETLHRNSLRLLRLVNTLLDFTRLEDSSSRAVFRPVDLAELTTELAGTFRSACERAGLSLDVECEPLPEPAFVDPEMWEAIVLNLMSNAFKYTREGGITVTVRPGDGTAELAVHDTGAGIPEAEVERIFERFHRVAGTVGRTHEGTGIGLAFVRELVGRHGGTIRASGRPGGGTTLTVAVPLGAGHLPADRIGPAAPFSAGPGLRFLADEAGRWLDAPADAAPADTAPADGPEPVAGDERPLVLLADDNPDMRRYLARLLGQAYRVQAVADGPAALAAARARTPDLVLSDVMMPGLDGFGLLRELRAIRSTKEVPVILLSARAGEGSRIEGLESGADDYLVKPFTARELLARVDSHVRLSRLRHEAAEARREAARASAVVASEERLRLITDALPVLIGYVDSEMRYQFVNQAYEDWLGRPREEFIGRSVTEFWSQVQARLGLEPLRRALAGERTGIEWSVPDGRGGIRYCRSSFVPDVAPDGEVRGFFGVTADVTEEKNRNVELERRVVERTAELVSANKELESFSYSVSHDLRQPLRAIDGFIRILVEQHAGDLDPEARRYFDVVRENARRMGVLIDDLLEFSRLGRAPLAKTDVDTTELVNRCVADLAGECEGRDVRFGVAPLPPCRADTALLKQVWANLLGNAVKYTRRTPVAEITVGAQVADDGRTEFFVRDNGAGFDMRYAGKLFGVFQRLHRPEDYEGTGVGLAIVEQIVRRHGGQIHAEAEIDHGATFSFTLEPTTPDP